MTPDKERRPADGSDRASLKDPEQDITPDDTKTESAYMAWRRWRRTRQLGRFLRTLEGDDTPDGAA